MKRTFLFQLFVVAVLALGLMACDTRQDRDTMRDDRGTDTYTPGTGTDLGTDTRTDRDFYFFDDSRDYTYEERNQFRQDVQESRNRLDQEISRIETQINNVPADDRESYREKINDLKEKRDELDKEMKAFNRTTADNWDDFQSEVQSAWSDVEGSYEDIRDDLHNDNLIDLDRDNRDMNRNPDATSPQTNPDRSY
jgi:peptidoglycan hydrolase CwlO-like protein